MGATTSGTATAGPHDSNLMNKADPRVDSDRDGSRNMGAAAPGGTTTAAGPHDSNLMNKADPRVDSDRDGSGNMGAATSATGATGLGAPGTGSATGGNVRTIQASEQHHPGDGHPEDIVHPGPHMSETAKKLDPHMH